MDQVIAYKGVSLPDGAEVEVSTDGNGSAAISAGHSRFTLSTLPVADFPAMAEGDLAHSFVLSGEECRTLVGKTSFAMSTEETRYYLNGVYLHATENGEDQVLRAVSTDGHRLARQEVALPAGASGMPGVIIPRKTIGELSKLLEEGVNEVKISLSENKIRFVCGSAVLVSKLIDGTFPDYTRVIPAGNTRRLEVDADEFARAVDRVATVSSERSRAVKLQLEEDRLILSVNAPDSGAAEEELAVAYADERLEIGFNAKYLLEIANQVDRENAVFMFNSSGDPTLMREGNDTSAVYVVMPMRV